MLFSRIFFTLCNSSTGTKSNCKYILDDLLQKVDSPKIEIKKYEKDSMTEAVDVSNNILEGRGLYKFDNNNVLRFYGFLVNNNNNDCYFSVFYDSSGSEIKRTGDDVVRWYAKTIAKDSFQLIFYLYAINNNFNNLKIKIDNYTISNINLVPSKMFSNLLGFSTIISKNITNRTIYITGERVNTCNKEKFPIKDSVILPNTVIDKLR